MLTIERLVEGDWRILRELRLEALGEAPYAFWATRAHELTLQEADWRRFLVTATWFVARRGGRPLGMAAGVVREETPAEPELIGMWVAPSERGHGVGSQLVEEVLGWARSLGAVSMTLWVSDGNEPARRLYEQLGFRGTGERGSMPHAAAHGTERMRLTLRR